MLLVMHECIFALINVVLINRYVLFISGIADTKLILDHRRLSSSFTIFRKKILHFFFSGEQGRDAQGKNRIVEPVFSS